MVRPLEAELALAEECGRLYYPDAWGAQCQKYAERFLGVGYSGKGGVRGDRTSQQQRYRSQPEKRKRFQLRERMYTYAARVMLRRNGSVWTQLVNNVIETAAAFDVEIPKYNPCGGVAADEEWLEAIHEAFREFKSRRQDV